LRRTGGDALEVRPKGSGIKRATSNVSMLPLIEINVVTCLRPVNYNSKDTAMRSHFVCTILTILPTIAWAGSDGIPTLDVRPVCRGIASQSADPGVGQKNQNEAFQQCIESEQAVREQLKRGWSAFSAEDKRHCVTLATTGGESSNTELLTCLEMARDVRALRSAYSGAETAKPVPSPATPAAQPTTMVPSPDKEVPKKEENEAKGEAERAKLEAQITKASEASAQRKLADAESALKKAKDEAQRVSAELERAKAEAQNARESEAVIKTKLADAVAARAKAEQACHGIDTTRPGLGGRLRRWLGRPGSPNP
jgi:hypothetical protein